MTNIRAAIDKACHILGQTHSDSRLEAEILLAEVLNKNRAYLFAHQEDALSSTELSTYEQWISLRAQGQPIAYITGKRDFWSLTLNVNSHTLIPRHETERLVELTLELLPPSETLDILDLGTGSGAIALSLAKERPAWHIDACDVSAEALKIAKHNAKTNGIHNVSFYESNWFNQLPNKKYHAIVANPPYIANEDPHLNQGDLRFEPLNALISGQEGLADLEYITEHGYNWLLTNGLLLLEHGYEQKLRVQSILNVMGFKKVHTWQDYLGHDRVTGGWRI